MVADDIVGSLEPARQVQLGKLGHGLVLALNHEIEGAVGQALPALLDVLALMKADPAAVDQVIQEIGEVAIRPADLVTLQIVDAGEGLGLVLVPG